MISVILTLLLVLASGWALSSVCNRRIEECVPVILTGTVVLLYIFYYLNLLAIGRICVYAAVAILVVLVVVKRLRSAKTVPFDAAEPGSASGTRHRNEGIPRIFSEFLTPGIVMFLLLAIGFLILSASLKPAVWDELRLWAAMPKALHFSGTLQVGEGSLLYSTMQSYPPGIALLVFFFTSFSSVFSYGSTFAVYWIFCAALLLPAFRSFSWKQWYVPMPAMVLILAFPAVLTINGDCASGDWAFYYTSLYIEPVLGVLFGAALFQAVKDPFRNGFDLTVFSLTMFLLPMLKNIGTLYAAAALAAAVILRLMNQTWKKETTAGRNGDGTSEASKGWLKGSRILLGLIPLALTALSYGSWQYLINTRGTGEFIDVNLASFTGERAVNVVKGLTSWGHIPVIFFLLFFLAADVLLTLLLKDLTKKQALTAALVIFAAFLIFLYGYTSHYGLMLSSIYRYTSTFTFACFAYLLMRLVSVLHTRLKPVWRTRAMQAAEEAASSTEVKKPYGSILETLLPKKGIRANRLAFLEVLLLAASLLVVVQSQTYQLANEHYEDAGRVISQATARVQEDLQADGLETSAAFPTRCYLALGGDIREQSQRHETYALETIGTSINIHNIWCDKIFNEATDGVVDDPETAARLWAEELAGEDYAYVLIADPDEEILHAVQLLSSEISSLKDGMVFEVLPSDGIYPVTLSAV